MAKTRSRLYHYIFYVCIFMFAFIWFSSIKPFVVYDADDWTYIGYVRKAMPIWGDWNPARVLPEVLMALCGTVASIVVAPLTGDWLFSVTLVCAFAVSCFITMYISSFMKMLIRLYDMDLFPAMAASVLFLSLHFLIFRISPTGNNYLLNARDLTCFFYYIIPGLLNASLVMHMIGNPRYNSFTAAGNWFGTGVFFAVLYFAIFSNMTASGILATYAGYRILTWAIHNARRIFTREFWKNCGIFAGIVAVWLASAIFELNGGRSMSRRSMAIHSNPNLPLGQRLMESLNNFINVLRSECSGLFIGFCAVCVVLSAVIFIIVCISRAEKKPSDAVFGRLLVMGAICIPVITAYMAILTATVNTYYMTRSDYLFSIFFFVILCAMLGLGYAVTRLPRLMAVLPVTICIMLSCINTSGNTFILSSLMAEESAEAEYHYEVSSAIMQQFIDADSAGTLEEMKLYVPEHGDGNWPHSLYIGDRISSTLYEFGIISKAPQITVEPDPDFFERFSIPLP